MTSDLSERLIDLVGEEGLIRLAEEFGGQRIYIPHNAVGSQIEKRVGLDIAIGLSSAYNGTYIAVPLARVYRANAYRSAGASLADIARRLGITESAVSRLMRRSALAGFNRSADERQMDFFK